jgi:hypothetical protein
MSIVEKWLVWVGSLLVTITGTVYLVMKYWLPEPPGFSVIRHPLQPLFLKLHILTAPILLIALGAIGGRHIWRHIAAGTRQGRKSGWSAVLVIMPMIMTGYLLQVFSDERWVRLIALAHIVAGVAFVISFGVHQVVAVRWRRAAGEIIAKGNRRPRRHRRTGARRLPS